MSLAAEFPELLVYGILTADAGVSAVAGAKVFPGLAPPGTSLPIVIYQRMSSERVHSLTGPVGVPVVSVQITSWGTSYETGKTLSRAVRLALDGYSGTSQGVTVQRVTLTSDSDVFQMPQDDQATPYYGVSQIYEFRVQETV
jgi:hypothetical protein